MSNELREEIVEELEDVKFGATNSTLFKPFVKCWRALVRECQPLFDFHDKYIMRILPIVLVVGTALVVGWVYLRR